MSDHNRYEWTNDRDRQFGQPMRDLSLSLSVCLSLSLPLLPFSLSINLCVSLFKELLLYFSEKILAEKIVLTPPE